MSQFPLSISQPPRLRVSCVSDGQAFNALQTSGWRIVEELSDCDDTIEAESGPAVDEFHRLVMHLTAGEEKSDRDSVDGDLAEQAMAGCFVFLQRLLCLQLFEFLLRVIARDDHRGCWNHEIVDLVSDLTRQVEEKEWFGRSTNNIV